MRGPDRDWEVARPRANNARANQGTNPPGPEPVPMPTKYGRTTEQWCAEGERLLAGPATRAELSAWESWTMEPHKLAGDDPVLRRRLLGLRARVRRVLRAQPQQPESGEPPCSHCPTHCPVAAPQPRLARVTGRLGRTLRADDATCPR
jgi:hypothetical protein